MTTMTEPPRPAATATAVTANAGPAGLPRLLPPDPGIPEDLRAHLARHGRPPYRGGPGLLIPSVAEAGLTGRGGAAFPVHRKLAVVAAARGRKVIVANGAESEPASRKDALLLRVAPNLVLDGLQLAAEAVGAAQVHLYLHPGAGPAILRALAERHAAALDRLPVTVTEAPPRFLAGQESALVSRLGGGPARPTFVPPRVWQRGLGGAPTLVQNVETLAHLALIARYGPRWFRELGTAAEPGTMLTTVHQPDGQTQVIEAELGTPLRTLLPALAEPQAAQGPQEPQAVLVGGFHGTWLPAPAAATLTLDNQALNQHGAALGAGVVAALPAGRCGLAEAAGVTRYLAAESAGQCGPCLNGLPAVAGAMAELARPGRTPNAARQNAERWTGPQNLVTGRGACGHPDGTARFVRSTLTVFAEEIGRHERGQCSATNRAPFLPLPAGMPTTEDDWT
jgi:NADH:ubiquinone oxidoreductase subunit F (NADH-binding)